MYFPEDIWKYIKSFKFHNIKTQGKHLKNDIYIKLYNLTLKLMPPLLIPRIGCRIVYSSAKDSLRFIKFMYLRPMRLDIKTRKYINNFYIRETQILDLNKSYDEYKLEYLKNKF